MPVCSFNNNICNTYVPAFVKYTHCISTTYQATTTTPRHVRMLYGPYAQCSVRCCQQADRVTIKPAVLCCWRKQGQWSGGGAHNNRIEWCWLVGCLPFPSICAGTHAAATSFLVYVQYVLLYSVLCCVVCPVCNVRWCTTELLIVSQNLLIVSTGTWINWKWFRGFSKSLIMIGHSKNWPDSKIRVFPGSVIFVPGSKNIFFAFSNFSNLKEETDVADHDRLCEKIVRPQNKGISRVGDFWPWVKILFWDYSYGKGIIEVADHDRLDKKIVRS